MKKMIYVFLYVVPFMILSGCKTTKENDREGNIARRQIKHDFVQLQSQYQDIVNENMKLQKQVNFLETKLINNEEQLEALKRYISELNRNNSVRLSQAAFKHENKIVNQQNSFVTNKQTQNITGDEPVGDGEFYVHEVDQGQTLSAIARKYKVKVSEIKKTNRLQTDLIRVGQRLYIPKK